MVAVCILGIVLLVVVVFIAYFVYFFNRVVTLGNQIDNSWSQIDVQLKRRADLIPKLVDTVKGYMAHERGVLEAVTNARTAFLAAQGPARSMEASNALAGALKTLFAVAENYPQLKASANFLQLQEEISHTENRIAYARQHYNDVVTVFNNTVETFPGTVFAGMLGKKRRDVLQIPENEKRDVKISI